MANDNTTEIGWELYRSYLGVLEEGSLSGAARAMGIAQPTVGRHVDALEKALGVTLFTRSQMGLLPTEAALALKPFAKTMHSAAAALKRVAESQGSGIQGTVRVTASEVIGQEVLPPILAQLQDTHPDLTVELVLTSRVQDLLQREADIADRMYREFTEFDKYAAAHYTPILGDMTSELVSEVTEGKYDRVEFDGNYAIEIFDGSDECFPLATFSGGERDAIALCARLALSRMIGSQAASPPGFLVLDEVFGSLDRERRSRLLEMLGSISASNESFRQMFIISHVDDVRTAPLFDELWRIEESEDGISQIRSLNGRVEVDDL